MTLLLFNQFKVNIHKDVVFEENRNSWKGGNHPYNQKRPAVIFQDYDYRMFGENTEVKLMSPYGGTIYVNVLGDVECDVTISGGIEMPYFVQGKQTIFYSSSLKLINFCFIINFHRSNNK